MLFLAVSCIFNIYIVEVESTLERNDRSLLVTDDMPNQQVLCLHMILKLKSVKLNTKNQWLYINKIFCEVF